MLTLTPVVCVLAAIAFSNTFEVYLKDDSPKQSQKNVDENGDNKNDRLYDKVKDGCNKTSHNSYCSFFLFFKSVIDSSTYIFRVYLVFLEIMVL